MISMLRYPWVHACALVLCVVFVYVYESLLSELYDLCRPPDTCSDMRVLIYVCVCGGCEWGGAGGRVEPVWFAGLCVCVCVCVCVIRAVPATHNVRISRRFRPWPACE